MKIIVYYPEGQKQVVSEMEGDILNMFSKAIEQKFFQNYLYVYGVEIKQLYYALYYFFLVRFVGALA